MLAGWSGWLGWRQISALGDVIGKSKTGDVTSLAAGALLLAAADGSVQLIGW